MEQPKSILERGFKIKINDTIEDPRGMMIKHEYLSRRTPGINGVILGCVPGHGGDVYWVFHGESIGDLDVDHEQVSVYGFWEFENRD